MIMSGLCSASDMITLVHKSSAIERECKQLSGIASQLFLPVIIHFSLKSSSNFLLHDRIRLP